jgi:hypothetical protein
LLGNDNITFTGTNFPHQLEGNTFDLKFSDDDNTPCLIQSSKTDEFVCLTQPFDRDTSAGQTYTLVAVING